MPCHVEDTRTEDLRQAYRMLCGVCGRIEQHYQHDKYIKPDAVLAAWWQKHKQRDAEEQARIDADRKRKELIDSAAKKLSKAEREALGLR